jgi:hypothetical protein
VDASQEGALEEVEERLNALALAVIGKEENGGDGPEERDLI